MPRIAEIKRKTKETDISIELNIDGTGQTSIDTGVGFFDHMLTLFGRHSLFNLSITCKGDLDVDAHHTVEDVGICLGNAISKAIIDKAGIKRYGTFFVPMDEALVMCSLDFSGRGMLVIDMNPGKENIGNFDTELCPEFFRALAHNAGINLHIKQLNGSNAHHIIEAAFKACARAMRQALEIDEKEIGIPSTKGML
ncbi:MAG: imidazoleglycerol-phosphate dehydratase HisB [Armatimonadota bacterium]